MDIQGHALLVKNEAGKFEVARVFTVDHYQDTEFMCECYSGNYPNSETKIVTAVVTINEINMNNNSMDYITWVQDNWKNPDFSSIFFALQDISIVEEVDFTEIWMCYIEQMEGRDARD